MPPRRRRSWQSLPALDPTRVGALSQALDLALAPTLVAHLRCRPLPRDVLTLIRLAAGCRETLAEAAAATGREPDFLLAAAEAYLRQVVCFSGASPCRTLGLPPEASRAELRRHMRELVLWLHPDRAGPDRAGGGNAALMRRVIEAWHAVDNPAAARVVPAPAPVRARTRRIPVYRPSWIARPPPKARSSAAAAGRRLRTILRLALTIAGLVVPALGLSGLCGLTIGLARSADDPCLARFSSGAGAGVAPIRHVASAADRCGA